MIPQPNKIRKADQEAINEFLYDIHQFTRKWRLTEVSERIFGFSRQSGQDRIKTHLRKMKKGGK